MLFLLVPWVVLFSQQNNPSEDFEVSLCMKVTVSLGFILQSDLKGVMQRAREIWGLHREGKAFLIFLPLPLAFSRLDLLAKAASESFPGEQSGHVDYFKGYFAFKIILGGFSDC